jgi:hypothetical protein
MVLNLARRGPFEMLMRMDLQDLRLHVGLNTRQRMPSVVERAMTTLMSLIWGSLLISRDHQFVHPALLRG